MFFLHFVDNSSGLLLCKIYAFDILNKFDFVQIFIIMRRTEIRIISNLWLGVYK